MLRKVLIVDDSEGLQQIYKVTLKRYRCETIGALRREEALNQLAAHPDTDLILVDMNMPLSRMSGVDFIRKVRAQEAYAGIPIVVITIKGKDCPKEAFDLADGNLMKPFTSNEVHNLIKKLFPQALSA